MPQLTTNRHEASRGLSATAELIVKYASKENIISITPFCTA